MPYTTHGHQFGDTSQEEERPLQVAKCGGPGICLPCSTEAARALRESSSSSEES